MRPHTKRAQQARETKQRIFQTALGLFERQGIENVSIKDIARESGCSIGNIYHYFHSKDEIVLKTLQPADETYEEVYEEIRTVEPFCSMSAKEQLAEFYCRTVEVCIHSPSLLRDHYLFAIKYPDYGTLQITGERRFQQIGIELIKKMQEEGNLAADQSPEQVLSYLVMQMRGLYADWLISGCKYDAVAAARKQVVLFIAGITAV